MSDKGKPQGLDLLRVPFEPHQISKLPKPTKRQTEEVRANRRAGMRCKVCGAWHHPDVVHLDYVGHAALTDRLLDCDQNWNWEPMALAADGSPLFDSFGGMWIKLTVCGVTRMGYGHPDGKRSGDAIKEVIGDALRNAAMRFGAALDLWHKGDLHLADEAEADAAANAAPNGNSAAPPQPRQQPAPAAPQPTPDQVSHAVEMLTHTMDLGALQKAWGMLPGNTKRVPAVAQAKEARKAQLEQPEPMPVGELIDDELPY